MTMEEESYDASFYDENVEANPKEEDPLKMQLKEVSQRFQKLDVIWRIKEHFQEELNKRIPRGETFDDFVLGTMKVLNSVSRNDSLEKFLREAYIGCFQCLLCLQSDAPDGELYKTSHRLLILVFLAEALSVIQRVLSEQGSVLPNLNSEGRNYEKSTLVHLTKLTEDYLRNRPESVRKYEQLIKDFGIVSEIARALRHLQNEFAELRRQPNRVSRRVNELTLFNQMEENNDLSLFCC